MRAQQLHLRRPHLGRARRRWAGGGLRLHRGPWFNARYPLEEWPRLAWWLYDHLLFHRVVVFSRQGSFNIGWRDAPAREVSSYLEPKGVLVGPRRAPESGRAALYADFPRFQDGR